MSQKLYLAIETSCDETSLAILKKNGDSDDLSFYNFINSFEVLGEIISSQIPIHVKFGGVIPEIGARQHADQIHFLFKHLLNSVTGKKPEELTISDADWEILSQIQTIFVTGQPGLVSALRVGIEFAKTLSYYLSTKTGNKIDVVEVNHLKGHTISAFYDPQKQLSISNQDLFPHLHLLVSGGNSQLILYKSPTNWEIVGQTLDDAAGECLDKIGRMLGLSYPGGVHIAKIAKLEDDNAIKLPVSMLNSGNLEYSFSGLKTAVRYYLQSLMIQNFSFENPLTAEEYKQLVEANFDPNNQKLSMIQKVCISAQSVVVKQLINKVEIAICEFTPNSIGVSGGVSANLLLRNKFQTLQNSYNLKHFFFPSLKYTGDNAVMIALAGLTS